MRVCYTDALAAARAVLAPSEQALMPVIGADDEGALRHHAALGAVDGQRLVYLVDICLQNGALHCGLALLRRSPRSSDAEARRARIRAMRLGHQAAERYLKGACLKDQSVWAKLSAEAYAFAAHAGFTRAYVPLLAAWADVFFLSAFGCTKDAYRGQMCVRPAFGAPLHLSLALLSFGQAQAFDAPWALKVLHTLLWALQKAKSVCNTETREDVLALHAPLWRMGHVTDDPSELARIRQCIRLAQNCLASPDTNLEKLFGGLGLKHAAHVRRLRGQDAVGAPVCRTQSHVVARPAKAVLAPPKQVRFH